MEFVLRNIVTFEQCHCEENFINDCVDLMNFLLNSSKDVDLLVKNGIIQNWLRNSKGVSILFHNLVLELASSETYDGRFYFSSVAEDLNKY
ncbi:hypothetical protein Pint_31143 [Pistacia integerrima]|uniref:Uncharacterized protein n=1 Tax=Pistacia integerrima TaxID=434235 RepID=A0ACC0XSV5_9ROSI|nr:hypothetical protein Pint_31143 [Pistacia integerrima]